jgi:hypothetical protein
MRAVMAFMVAVMAAGNAWAAERLQVPESPGWKIVASVSDRAGEANELIPEAETEQNWTRRISIQAFRNVGLTVPEFLDQVARKVAEVCDGATAGPPSLGKVSGAEAGTRTVACGRYKGDGRGTFALYYAIRGKDALYVVTRMWRGEPFNPAQVPISQAELAEWTDYVNALDLCDTRTGRCR